MRHGLRAGHRAALPLAARGGLLTAPGRGGGSAPHERPAVGLSLHADPSFLEFAAALPRGLVEVFEVVPETLWRLDRGSGALVPNGFLPRVRDLARARGARIVGHGVGASPGSVGAGEIARKALWRAALRDTARLLDFEFASDHLGTTALAGRATLLPLPLAPGRATLESLRSDLRLLVAELGSFGLENASFPFALGDPLRAAEQLAAACEVGGVFLVLDLENLLVDASNLRFDPCEFLRRLPLDRVREVHVAGGSKSPSHWTPSRRRLRLDSHDAVVRPQVWALLEELLPRLPALELVVLERMEGTVEDEEARREVAADLEALHSLLRGQGAHAAPRAGAGRKDGPSAAAGGRERIGSRDEADGKEPRPGVPPDVCAPCGEERPSAVPGREASAGPALAGGVEEERADGDAACAQRGGSPEPATRDDPGAGEACGREGFVGRQRPAPPAGGGVKPDLDEVSRLALEDLLERCLRAREPVAALAAAIGPMAEGPVRGLVESIDPDGFAVAARLVAKLRFRRLVSASAEAGRMFALAPEAFAEAFRRYHEEVAPFAWPREEGEAFSRFLRRP